MRIIRFFHNIYQDVLDDVLDEEITQGQEKSFDQILQEEHARLIQLISETQENGTIEQLYLKYNPRITDHKFPEE